MEMIVSEMETNRRLYNGVFSASYTASMKQAEWDALAARLNADGGAVKTTKQWQKVSIF